MKHNFKIIFDSLRGTKADQMIRLLEFINSYPPKYIYYNRVDVEIIY